MASCGKNGVYITPLSKPFYMRYSLQNVFVWWKLIIHFLSLLLSGSCRCSTKPLQSMCTLTYAKNQSCYYFRELHKLRCWKFRTHMQLIQQLYRIPKFANTLYAGNQCYFSNSSVPFSVVGRWERYNIPVGWVQSRFEWTCFSVTRCMCGRWNE